MTVALVVDSVVAPQEAVDSEVAHQEVDSVEDLEPQEVTATTSVVVVEDLGVVPQEVVQDLVVVPQEVDPHMGVVLLAPSTLDLLAAVVVVDSIKDPHMEVDSAAEVPSEVAEAQEDSEVVISAVHPASPEVPQEVSPQAQVLTVDNLAKDLEDLPAKVSEALLAQEDSVDCNPSKDSKASKDFKDYPLPQVIKEVALLPPHQFPPQAELSVDPNQVTNLKDSLAEGHNKATASTTRNLYDLIKTTTNTGRGLF